MKLKESTYPKSFVMALLMPCYNNYPGLLASLASIQFPRNKFVVVIVDDGSRPPISLEMIKKAIDPSIHLVLITNPENTGIANALNIGLEYIDKNFEVNYLARLDCGDICAADRFTRQIAYLENHPSVGIIGSWCLFRNPDSGKAYAYQTPTVHREIKRNMLFRNQLIHPSVIWRWKGNNHLRYPLTYPHAEDYAFFYEILNSQEAAIVNEYLVTCEVNAAGLSATHRKEQMRSRKRVIRKFTARDLKHYLALLKLNLLIILPPSVMLAVKYRLFGRTANNKRRPVLSQA